ncbi:bone sialoprotein 2 isoform X3 [Oreochromis niloticus]|nr:bone sialoprotein 2 isoform X3 [Oreochromis niloticus]
MSRVFDEVMGLGDFADSSRGSNASSKSGEQDETKGVDQTSGQEEQQPMEEEEEVEEENSNCSKKEEKIDKGAGESSLPRIASPTSDPQDSFKMGSSDGGGGRGGSGAAAFDDALDGLPSFGQEEDDEDWHFALPMGTLEDVDVDKAGRKSSQQANSEAPSNTFGSEPKVGEEEEEEEEQEERAGSTGSANTFHSSQDNSRDAGVLNQTEETEDSEQEETSEAAPVEDSNPPISPSVNIKEEPIDEGYDAALLPQSSIRQIKEELEHQEEELRISSVFSVGGGNTFASPTMPAAVPAPAQTAIFIPGRGAVLQAMAPSPSDLQFQSQLHYQL